MLGLGIGSSVESSDFAPKSAAGFSNTKSIELDGTGDHVTTYADNSDTLKEILSGSPTATDKGFTISSWINSDFDASSNYWGVANSDSTGIVVKLSNTNIANVVRFMSVTIKHSNIHNQTLNYATDYYDSGNVKWEHIVLVFEVDDSASDAHAIIKVYRNAGLELTNSNGAEYAILSQGAPSGNGTFSLVDTGFVIGGVDQKTGALSTAESKIDEFAIFNTALSASEVSEIYNSGVPADLTQHSKAANLVNYYRFEGDTTDTQGNQNGTAQGDPTFSTNVPS
jgi:hypothetical protein